MLNAQELNQTVCSARYSKVLQVINKFKIREVPCLVIVIEKTIENRHIEKILNPYLLILDISHFSENTRFPIDDQLCILLEAKSSSSNSQLDIPKLLAEQELQIASLVAQGYLNKQIAKQLHISEWTAATPLHRIFAKLRVESGAAMVY